MFGGEWLIGSKDHIFFASAVRFQERRFMLYYQYVYVYKKLLRLLPDFISIVQYVLIIYICFCK